MATTYETYNLIQYGAQNLSTNKCITSNAPGADEGYFEVQRMENARGEGSSVVNNRIAEKLITLTGTLKVPTGNTKTYQEIINEHKLALAKRNRYLLMARKWVACVEPDITSYSWDAANGGMGSTEPYDDVEDYQLGTHSVAWNPVVAAAGSAGYFSIVSDEADLPACDLSSVDETGIFGIWVYFPDVYYIDHIEFLYGVDGTANSWENDDLTQQFDGEPLENGWNFIAWKWEDMTENGTVDPSAFNYVRFMTYYSAGQASDTGWRFGGLVWMDDDENRSYRSYVQNVRIDNEHFNVSSSPFQFEFVASKGIAEGVSELSALSEDDITDAADVQELDFGGTANPKPKLVYSLTDTTDWDTITIANLTTDQQIVLDESWANSDELIIDEDELAVTRNGTGIDYENVLPLFVPGVNRLQTTIADSNVEEINYETQNGSTTPSFDYFWAQSFTTVTAGDIVEVQLYLKKYTGTSPYAQVEIWSDDSGDPDSLVGFVGFMSTTSTSYTWVTKSCNIAVDAATKYWVVAYLLFRGLYGDNGVYWGRDTAGAYAGQTLKEYDIVGASWSDTSDDGDFRVYVQPSATIDYDLDVTYRKRYL